MTRPTRRCLLLFVAGLPVAVLPAAVDGRLWTLWIVVLAASVALVALDALRLPSRRALAVDVVAPGQLAIGASDVLAVTARSAARRPTAVDVLGDLGPLLDDAPLQRMTVGPAQTARTEVALRPRRRGVATVHRLWLRWTGPLGLMSRIVRHELDLAIPVVPDVRNVRTVAIRFFGTRRTHAGLKTERYLGDGSEFEALRRYEPGFDPRSLDWKASARHGRLLCRQFRAERNHQIVLAFDTGHLMQETLDGIPRLDHAVNHALVLAYAGLRTGDRVGMCSYDSQLRHWTSPGSGMAAYSRIQEHLARLEYGTEETNHTLAVLEISARLRRRSLIVVFTDFLDAVSAELMIENMDRLARRHLVLFVALADPLPERLIRTEPRSLTDLNRAVVASDLLRERRAVFDRLRRSGVHVLQANPDELSTGLVNRYLDIKRRELV